MEQEKKSVLNRWLEIEFYKIANKANLIYETRAIDVNLIYDSIRVLDYETIISKKTDVNYVITIIGLMWEHVNHTMYDLKSIIVKFLSRIGYPTSAIICDKNFDSNECSFSKLNSYIDEILSTMNQLKNEIDIAGKKVFIDGFSNENME